MRILICNERFLFRFGLDRVLLILAQGLSHQGHEVTLMGHRCDESVVAPFIKQFIQTPAAPGDYLFFDDFTADWVRENWSHLFAPDQQPDLILLAGWPFFQAADFFLTVCPSVIFQDHGAVPLDGFEGHGLRIQQRVRELRRQAIPKMTAVVAVSDFIAQSQSIPDRGGNHDVSAILNGANHLELPLWKAHLLRETADQPQRTSNAAMQKAKELLASGSPCILNLGRWEPNCYKNSQVWLTLMPRLRKRCPNVTLIVLGNADDVKVPWNLRNQILPIGCPDDSEMRQLMSQVTLGVSVSQWEGFNLPLGEMQWLDKPALAFNLGAHPEVVVHPWFLCENETELIDKIEAVLNGAIPEAAKAVQNYDRFRTNFDWSAVLENYAAYFQTILAQQSSVNNNGAKATSPNANLEKLVASHHDAPPSPSHHSHDLLIIDVTNSARDPANSGVVRVTRQLCRSLQQWIEPVFVVWDFEQKQYRLPSGAGYHQLHQFNGPRMPTYSLTADPDSGLSLADFLRLEPAVQEKSPLFLFAEVLLDERADSGLDAVLAQGWDTAAILYDLIPVFQPEFCSDEIRTKFIPYLKRLSQVDAIAAISGYSADCLNQYWQDNGISYSGQVSSVLLPGEFKQQVAAEASASPSHHSGSLTSTQPNAPEIQILCVSTLEPRKNHRTLLRACEILSQDYSHLNWKLTLVGNLYAGAPEIHKAVEKAMAKNHRITWLGIVDDVTLNQCYEQADFTVYSSLVEGFGMPILESIWHGKPCVCNHNGVMAELAQEGGCQTVDMTQPVALAKVLAELIGDAEAREHLACEAKQRKLTTWSDYTQAVCSVLDVQLKEIPMQAALLTKVDAPSSEKSYPAQSLAAARQWLKNLGRTPEWHELLYPQCLMQNWQMQDSEKMALTALLARHQPACSIEIGTYHGGSLSLIAQYSGAVFSIDIDPEVPGRLPPMDNVSYFTGDSRQLLPMLFEALGQDDLAIDFVLIDGDHSAEGVKRDLNLVLDYKPRKPMFVMMHDSFNPECRRGILEANWKNCPYVSWVEVDFVPGRMIEGDNNPFRGELWGGLALGLMVPEKRQGELEVGQSARELYELAHTAYQKSRKGQD